MRLTVIAATFVTWVLAASPHQLPAPGDRVVTWPGDHSKIVIGSFAPDGNSVAFSDLSKDDYGDLHLRDLATGAVRRLTSIPDDGYASSAAISTSGKSVAFLVSGLPGDRMGLHILPISGAPPLAQRALVPRAWIWPTEWSADDQLILVYALGDTDMSGRRLGIVTVRTGQLRILKTMPSRESGRASLSPDGSLIAYDYPPAAPPDGSHTSRSFDLFAPPPSRDRDIYLLPTDGGSEIRVDDASASDSVVGWAANGRDVIVVSDRGGSPALWALPMTRTGLAGPPRLLVAGFDGEPIGLSATGDLLYRRARPQPDGTSAVEFRIVERLLDRRPVQ